MLINVKFAERVRAAMQTQGIKQHELARLSGVSQATISLFLNAKVTLGLENAVAIASALRISLDELRGEEDQEDDTGQLALAM